MRYLLYVTLLVLSEISLATMPKILKHTRLVYKAPANSKVLYRVKVKDPKDSSLKIKWFVDGEQLCENTV